mmetsp:Transcript_9947/g.28250  ORF Transcript_9947/g.28250 Transcript_9947/m.28250 type:complete len:253 (+) Transcript_9947:665-1423(+)
MGVLPSKSLSSRLVPRERRVWQVESWPLKAAQARGLCSRLSLPWTLAPRDWSRRITSEWPLYAAQNTGVLPSPSGSSTAAPSSTSAWTAALWPFSEAKLRGVAPSLFLASTLPPAPTKSRAMPSTPVGAPSVVGWASRACSSSGELKAAQCSGVWLKLSVASAGHCPEAKSSAALSQSRSFAAAWRGVHPSPSMGWSLEASMSGSSSTTVGTAAPTAPPPRSRPPFRFPDSSLPNILGDSPQQAQEQALSRH